MASGCVTVTNFNRHTTWLLRDEENAAIANSTPTCVAERILEVLQDEAARRRIVEGGLQTVATLEWRTALDRIGAFVLNPHPAPSNFLQLEIERRSYGYYQSASLNAAPGGGGSLENAVGTGLGAAMSETHRNFRGYDFVDFGCSEGGSFDKAVKWFNGGRGIGLDVDPKKVEKAQHKGLHAMVCDITQVVLEAPEVRFVIASHFLEHLPGLADVKRCVRTACRLARDFVYLEFPYFDADGFLFSTALSRIGQIGGGIRLI